VAVYKRAYKPYDGPLTNERWRFLVLPRYGFREALESRLLSTYLVLCFVPFLVELALVYMANSPSVRALIRIGEPPSDLLQAQFFLIALTIQGFLSFFLTAWLAPTLVSPDLVNGALPLLLSRPFSRREYVLGKGCVLLGLLSLVTWVPVSIVFSVQSSLAGGGWLQEHARVIFAIVVGAFTWISVLSLLGLAFSAWIRWRIIASAALFGVFFTGSAFGEIWHELMKNPWGRVANLPYLIGLIWTNLFDVHPAKTLAREMMNDRRAEDLPVAVAWLVLLGIGVLCVALLNARLRAREVHS
jgi:ABC-2 type transport system permease protein